MIRTRRALASAFIAAATMPVVAGVAQAAPSEEAPATGNTLQGQPWTPQAATDMMGGSIDLLALLTRISTAGEAANIEGLGGNTGI